MKSLIYIILEYILYNVENIYGVYREGYEEKDSHDKRGTLRKEKGIY